MEEYLSDNTNDIKFCFLRAGSVLFSCEICRSYLAARDGFVREVVKKLPKINTTKNAKSDAKMYKSITESLMLKISS